MKLFKFAVIFLILVIGQSSFAKDTIELVVPTPPGGAIDLTARALSKALNDKGINNIVIYHPGANGDIALAKVLENRESRILVASSANFVFSHLVFDRENIHVKDLELIGPSLTNDMAFYVPLNNSIKSFKDLIDRSKKSETPCATSNSHGELQLIEMNNKFGTKFVAVPYKGTGQLMPDLIGGHVDCAFDQIAPYTGVQDKIIILATSGIHPYKVEIPTINKFLPNYFFTNWFAVGIGKNSILLKNDQLIYVLKNWSQDKGLSGPLVEKSFVVASADAALNEKVLKETQHYKKIKK
jgi:tripartite-type tricarboxylate transporter receptor subunit TctC